MNHTIGLLLLSLSFAFAPNIGTETYPVTTRYDHLSDTTTKRLELVNDGSSPVVLTLYANAAFRGREPNESGRFWFTIAVTQGQVARKSPSQFAAPEPLILTLDDAELKLLLSEYQREYYELVRRLSESANVVIERNELSRLLKAKELSGRNGNVKFKLSAAALSALKDFIAGQVLVRQEQSRQSIESGLPSLLETTNLKKTDYLR